MTVWMHGHGLLVGRLALALAIAAVAVPVVALFVGLPALFGMVPYPAVNPMQIALTLSAVLTILGLAAGLAVWIMHTPGYYFGMTAVLILGAVIFLVGVTWLGGYLMSMAHSAVRA